MNIFYEEVLVSADLDRGISFTSCLMILAHYNVISDNKSLRLEEFLRRRARLQRVEEAVRRNIVIGFFDTMYWSRRFRRAVEARRGARMTAVPQFAVPEIFVDDQDDVSATQQGIGHSPMLSPRDVVEQSRSRGLSLSTGSFDGSSISPDYATRNRNEPRDNSRSGVNRLDGSPRLSPHRPSYSDSGSAHSDTGWGHDRNLSASSASPVIDRGADGHSRSRQNSNVSAQDVLEVLDNSAWGESIRRSFTMRRPGSRSPGGGDGQR